jgi:hypothetical protein
MATFLCVDETVKVCRGVVIEGHSVTICDRSDGGIGVYWKEVS